MIKTSASLFLLKETKATLTQWKDDVIKALKRVDYNIAFAMYGISKGSIINYIGPIYIIDERTGERFIEYCKNYDYAEIIDIELRSNEGKDEFEVKYIPIHGSEVRGAAARGISTVIWNPEEWRIVEDYQAELKEYEMKIKWIGDDCNSYKWWTLQDDMKNISWYRRFDNTEQGYRWVNSMNIDMINFHIEMLRLNPKYPSISFLVIYISNI